MSKNKFTMKVLGKCRDGTGDPVKEMRIFQETVTKLRKNGLAPKGLYRFRSHEEADKWMIKNLINSRVPLKSKT